MKDNKLSIVINKPINEVFSFTINPENTPLWIDFIEFEKVDSFPIHKGTIYTNKSKNTDGLRQYDVVGFKENEIFELAAKHASYNVRYSYKSLDESTTELEYYEYDTLQDLSDPFTQDILEKLKNVLENMC